MSVPRESPLSSSVLSNTAISSSPDTIRDPSSPLSGSPGQHRRSSDGSDLTARHRRSPTHPRSFDPEARERQRTMDVDMAMQLSRARRETVLTSPEILPLPERIHEDEETRLNHGAVQPDTDDDGPGLQREPSRIDLSAHLDQSHDPELLANTQPNLRDSNNESLFGLPTYQANVSRSEFDFTLLEEFAAAEKALISTSPTTKFQLDIRSPRPKPPSVAGPRQTRSEPGPSTTAELPSPSKSPSDSETEDTPRIGINIPRHRKISQSNSQPRAHRRGIGGKMALFEAPHDPYSAGTPTAAVHASGASPASRVAMRHQPPFGSLYDAAPPPPLGAGIINTGHDRPYRFSFYSNAMGATIHARSLSELPAEGQTFEQLFSGINPGDRTNAGNGGGRDHPPPPSFTSSREHSNSGSNGNRRSTAHLDQKNGHGPGGGNAPGGGGDHDDRTWWLDVMSPTDDEMKMLSKVFSIHPLTTEDIQMEETREKIELFRNYYLVCFRSFDQDPYSPTYLEPLNMYIIVFREGTLSFHFRPTPHPQNVRRRIKQLKDYISVTSDWISYALIDDITDAFGPLIQSIEYEVDSIDELVLILKETEQSDMLRRIGTCRKKVMGLLRLMGNKADVVKGLAKRCNENWRVAPTSDIGLYLSDIQDHLITMTQNLNHYEKILSRSHSNYLAQISIEMTDANNQINDVLSKLTALGTVLIPMNLVTGLWGMNVHVPGQDVPGYTWFISIVAGLAVFALVGGYVTYRFMVRAG
ncbi:putative corA-like Mg2+ transporter protein [Lyophyllum shimeji]|uniref:CorA-like Mg2+ transporter protein n=1 Tax=Lyophyllum shimeji TaxID=47721 RepID=A0A9P3PEL5_LYOSH|nr:putative corA-like Mg2+ transporter protein [Lyophyllum shimeji]